MFEGDNEYELYKLIERKEDKDYLKVCCCELA